ncbi:hypothetical protein [Nostoc sp. ChiQUE01b]|uniref:hypothetical protein n=1 Tax=Nostoc sp. ChiQUE01b TaxID=3075376 RepID=UPI002AD3CAEC|nr:hypothetical protein [Nostoc sp. ChiQUE01b]MDZ8258029.1 hypothetical protein [Nostoc sp. ChiQUE01b]
MVSLTLTSDKVAIGNDAAWILTFHTEDQNNCLPRSIEEIHLDGDPVLEIGRDDYYAEIRASLPGGLEGGSYSFVIEGLIDQHYEKIAQGKKKSPTIVKLYLYWRDTNSSVAGYLTNLAGLTDVLDQSQAKNLPEALVAVLKIVSVTRKVGTRRYETTITARERIFEILNTKRLCNPGIAKDTTPEAIKELLETRAGLKSQDYKLYPTKQDRKREFKSGSTIRELLDNLGRSLEAETQKYGRGMFLIRADKEHVNSFLHIGERPIPLGKPQDLRLGNGLIEVESLATVAIDPNFDTCAHPNQKPPQRRQFKLTLKGRPDIKPGDTVRFDLPPEEVEKTTSGLLGALGDLAAAVTGPLLPSLGDSDFKHPATLYIASVEHALGRTSGFVTTVTGVEVKDDAWDKYTDSSQNAPSQTQETHASPEVEAARAVKQLSQGAVAAKSFAEIGEIRQMNPENKGANQPPSQTLTVWQGLEPGKGEPNQACSLPIQRPSPAPTSHVPYTTLFAWGKCGLVLPRYPGTRVLVTHRDGKSDDPIEIGALWESGHGPDSQPGDWWLSLPVGVLEAKRLAIAQTEKPQEHTGKVTQDLIDAEGDRIIEVGELTIRVGKDSLKDAGKRPERPDDKDSVTIEHTKGGSKIVMKPDGSVEITAKKIRFDTSQSTDGIELDAGNGSINLKAKTISVDTGSSGTVEMTANTVDVNVQTSMNVN